jgi:molybdate transport system ATP-binding protein
MSDLRTAAEVAAISRNIPPPSAPLQAKLQKRLQSRGDEFLLDVAFDASPGFTILFGASGAGKTTLLDCLAGLTTLDSGRISLASRALFDSSLR